MTKKTKLIFAIIATISIVLILFISGILSCGIISAITLPQISQYKTDNDIILAKALKTNLFIAQTEYIFTEKKTPQKFSDFVLLTGKIKPPYTFSFEEIGFDLVKPDSPKDLETKDLRVLFSDGIEVIYHLEPEEIKVTFINPKIDNY